MQNPPDVSEPPAAVGLAYDELPEGSELRREYDGLGGVTITAPAGELPASVRRAAARAGLVPASIAFGVCLLFVGGIVFSAARANRLDPSLRSAAAITLGVLGVGVFLFVWLTHYAMLSYAMADARRESCVIHADGERLLVETAGPAGSESLDVPVTDLASIAVGKVSNDRTFPSAEIPCLELEMRDGSRRTVLGGHHDLELRWVAVALSDATHAPVEPPASRV